MKTPYLKYRNEMEKALFNSLRIQPSGTSAGFETRDIFFPVVRLRHQLFSVYQSHFG